MNFIFTLPFVADADDSPLVNDIILGVNKKEKTLIITPEGNLGIGTTLPTGVLDIRGGNLVIPENNNYVGIGLTNPKYNLDVKGTINTIDLISCNLITSNLKVLGDTTRLETTVYQTEKLEIYSDSIDTAVKFTQKNKNYNVLEVYNQEYLSFIIDKNSNIGIGTVSAQGLLHLNRVINDDVIIRLSDANNTSGVLLKKDSNQDFYISNTHTDGDIILGVNKKEKTLIITPEGNLGIGTTLPTGVLDIRGGNVVIPENDYKLGIGTTNPKEQLEIHKLGASDVVIRLTDESNLDGLVLKKDSNQDIIIKNNDANGDIIIIVTGKDKTLIITPKGNIGIGTTQPLGVFGV